jgi:hypothetical protein
VEEKTMSKKNKKPNRAKEATTRGVSKNDMKKAGHLNQASNAIRQPAQEIADDEVTIAKTGRKP